MRWAWAFLILCVIPLASADGFYDNWSVCTSEGYDYCTEYTFTYVYNNCPGDSYTNLSINNFNSRYILDNANAPKIRYGFYIGPVVLEYECSGYATITLGDSFPDNDLVAGFPDCNEYGCFGAAINSTGNITIAYPPYDHIPSWRIQCWDEWLTTCTYSDNSTQNVTTWSWQGRGYTNVSWIVVNCLNSSDCSLGETCDTRGEWYNWSCISNDIDDSYFPVINKTVRNLFSTPVVLYTKGPGYNATYDKNDLPTIVEDAVGTFFASVVSWAELLVLTGLLVSGLYLYRTYFDY